MSQSAPDLSSKPRRGSQSIPQLRDLQRQALNAIRHPLRSDGRTQLRWTDGRPMQEVAAAFIKPNDRLTSLERIEIYNRQYWYRLMDCLWDDFPGLRAILGDKKFEKLRIAYLNRYPSASFSLRNLGSRLAQFLNEEPRYIEPNVQMCHDMVRFEWAQIVAFDGPARPALTPDDLLGKNPAKLRLALQPYITVLEMSYPLDDFVIAVKKRDAALRSEASNAVETNEKAPPSRRFKLPRPETIHLVVHRYDNALYYKRLDPAAYALLCALRDGSTLAAACDAMLPEDDGAADWPVRIQQWFADWNQFGWFCRRVK